MAIVVMAGIVVAIALRVVAVTLRVMRRALARSIRSAVVAAVALGLRQSRGQDNQT